MITKRLNELNAEKTKLQKQLLEVQKQIEKYEEKEINKTTITEVIPKLQEISKYLARNYGYSIEIECEHCGVENSIFVEDLLDEIITKIKTIIKE